LNKANCPSESNHIKHHAFVNRQRQNQAKRGICAILRLALIGFVLLSSAGRYIAIISFQLRLCANSCRHKLALFFQMTRPEKIRIYYLLFGHLLLRFPTKGWRLALIGFDWLCFIAIPASQNLHNQLPLPLLHHFALSKIGFVFSNRYQLRHRFTQ
jgi:hypothetical protein